MKLIRLITVGCLFPGIGIAVTGCTSHDQEHVEKSTKEVGDAVSDSARHAGEKVDSAAKDVKDEVHDATK